jgi:protein gp37
MAACPQHDFLILTKRIRRALDWFAWAEGGAAIDRLACAADDALAPFTVRADRARWFAPGRGARSWPLPNVWIGVSVEDQKAADERIPDLLRIPAAVRFISAEPLLGPVDLRKYLNVGGICECPSDAKPSERCEGKGRKGWIRCNAGMRRLNWIIAGGESGPRSRACSTAWLETISEHCAEQLGMGTQPWPVPCFIKQLGAHVLADAQNILGGVRLKLKAKKGQRVEEWPDALKVQQYPEVRS